MSNCRIENKDLKNKNIYCTWMETVFRIRHGSILRPLLFDTFWTDLLFIISDIETASYADDNTTDTATDKLVILLCHWKKRPLPCSNGLIIIF